MIIADTGFLLALANGRDAFHDLAVRRLEKLADERLITTWPVVTETCHLLLRRVGATSQRAFVEGVAAGACAVFDLDRDGASRIAALMKAYEDLPMDLADGSLVVLAERLGHGRILSTDQRDFGTYRWKQRHPFENLFLDAS